MIISKKDFMELPNAHREQIIAALFQAQHQSFTGKHVGLDIDLTLGYSIRVAVVLTCELPDEVVKRIFVIQQDSNDFLTTMDIDEISTYIAELKKLGVFDPTRDDMWLLTLGKWSFEAYRHARGKVVFMDLDTLMKGIEEKYASDRELRDVLRHYGFVREKDTESF